MKTTILTQKTVCAFLGLIMAMTILWAAKAEAKDTNVTSVLPKETTIGIVVSQISEVEEFEIDLSDIQDIPTVTFINKYGEIVAEFYGDKNDITKNFKEILDRGAYITTSGNHEFYLVR